MKYLHLIWTALWRRKTRTILTLLSVLVAFLLFGLLDTVRSTFANEGQTDASRQRLLILAKSAGHPLTYSLLAKITEVPGVAGVVYNSVVSGTYQNDRKPIRVEAHSDTFFDVYPEVQAAPEDRKALQHTRTGVLAPEAFVKKNSLKVGDKIPLKTGQIRKDGSTVWTFELIGSFRIVDPNLHYETTLLGNWDYVDKARQEGTSTVDYYDVKVRNLSEIDQVSRAIDTLTANSDQETKTQQESIWAAAWAQELGDIGLVASSVMGAVFFTLLLLTGHTMMWAVYERVPELAVLKTIGFTGRRILVLVLCESVALIILGSALGLAIATVAVSGMRSADILPTQILPVGEEIWMRGLTIATVTGLLVGTLPALRGMRLRIVDALSGR